MSRDVARYYDRNTRRFLKFGEGGSRYSMHRLLWGPGVRTPEEAAAYVDRLVVDAIGETGSDAPTVVDLGCGVGGTLFRVAEAFPESRLHGMTVSQEQVDLAGELAAEQGLADRIAFGLGDFEIDRLGVEADAVVGIESLAHGRAPGHFLKAAAQHLRPGGRLVVADDFMTAEVGQFRPKERRIVATFRQGWRVPGLCTVQECVEAAARLGLELLSDEDLTDFIRLGRLRDFGIALVAPALGFLELGGVPFFGNLIGGNALRKGIRRGVLDYRLLVFERGDPPDADRE